MLKPLLSILVVLACMAGGAQAQTYADSMQQFRKKYIAELLAEPRAPVKHSQVGSITFFAPNPAYRVWATFTETPGSLPFKIQTHSGKQKPYREYGVLSFRLGDADHTLHVYQSIDLVQDKKYKDYLFIPFNDETNYETSYAGGRYIDLSVADIQDGRILLDFNKCYNPYCAYADGFSCPIPPAENRLHIAIPAGEKMFIH